MKQLRIEHKSMAMVSLAFVVGPSIKIAIGERCVETETESKSKRQNRKQSQPQLQDPTCYNKKRML